MNANNHWNLDLILFNINAVEDLSVEIYNISDICIITLPEVCYWIIH